MAKKFLIFQHMDWEGPGKFLLAAAAANSVVLEVVRLWEEPIPSFSSYDGLIVLGGSPNVDQENTFSYLPREKLAIRKWLTGDKPYLGFCLGHQLLAEALGATIGDNFCKSIGFVDGHLTGDGKEHPAFSGMPRKFSLFKWHGQTVREPLPKNVKVLVTSSECQVEAISVVNRPHIIGLQYDNHAADITDVAGYLENEGHWALSNGSKTINPDRVLSLSQLHSESIRMTFETFFANYLNLV